MHFISFKLFLWPTLPFCNYDFLHVKIGGWESQHPVEMLDLVHSKMPIDVKIHQPQQHSWFLFFCRWNKTRIFVKAESQLSPQFSAVVLPYFLLQPGSHTWANYYYHSLPRLRTPKSHHLKKMYQKKYQIPGMFRLSRHFTEHLLRFLALPVTVQSSQHSLSHVFTVRSSNLRKDFGCSACCSKPVAAAGA